MKKILALFVTALAVTVQAQVTNVVKISQLPSSNPLTGSELLPIVQSGSTVSATINQIIAGAVTIENYASNFLYLNITTNIANLVTVSNNANTFAATALSQVQATNAALQALLGATNTALLNAIMNTNAALIADLNAASNQLHGALISTNGIIQTEISSLGGGVTSGSSPTFGTVTAQSIIAPFYKTTSTNAGSLLISSSFPAFNLSNWQITQYTASGGSFGSFVLFNLSNAADGQNDSIVISVSSSIQGAVGFYATPPAGYTMVFSSGFTSINSFTGFGVNLPGGKTETIILNAEVVGTVIYCSGGVL